MNGKKLRFGAAVVVVLSGAVAIVWQQQRVERLETQIGEFVANKTRQAYSQAYALRRDDRDRVLRVSELQMLAGVQQLHRLFQELPEHHDRKAFYRRLLTSIADYFAAHPPQQDYFAENYDPGEVLTILKKYRSSSAVAQPGGPANGSQPIRSETNGTPGAAGPRR